MLYIYFSALLIFTPRKLKQHKKNCYAQSAIYSHRLTVYLNGEFVVKNEVLTAYDSMCLRFENLINKNYSIGYKKVKLGQKFNVLSFDKKK